MDLVAAAIAAAATAIIGNMERWRGDYTHAVHWVKGKKTCC